MLCDLLNLHPEVVALYELGLFGIYPKAGTQAKLTNEKLFREVFPWIYKQRSTRFNAKDIMATLATMYRDPDTYIEQMISYILDLSNKEGAKLVIDKLPNSCLNVAQICQNKDMGVITLQRDPHACINGTVQKTRRAGGRLQVGKNYGPSFGNPKDKYTGHIDATIKQFNLCRRSLLRAQSSNKNVHSTYYEILCRLPLSEMAGIYEFYGLDLPGLTDVDYHKHIRQDRLEAWKKELTAEEIEFITSRLGAFDVSK
jgi:hypothetical protein